MHDREDGVNVNGWHWEERDRRAWARERLPQLLTAATTAAGVRVVSATVQDGDCWVAVRKAGRVCAHYDLTLRVRWEAAGGGGGDATVKEFAPDAAAADDLHVEGAAGVEADLAAALLAAVEPFTRELEATLE